MFDILYSNKIRKEDFSMSKSIPVAVRFDNELNSFLTQVVQEKNTTKTDFIRQAVVEKLEDMYDIEMADKAFQK